MFKILMERNEIVRKRGTRKALLQGILLRLFKANNTSSDIHGRLMAQRKTMQRNV